MKEERERLEGDPGEVSVKLLIRPSSMSAVLSLSSFYLHHQNRMDFLAFCICVRPIMTDHLDGSKRK